MLLFFATKKAVTSPKTKKKPAEVRNHNIWTVRPLFQLFSTVCILIPLIVACDVSKKLVKSSGSLLVQLSSINIFSLKMRTYWHYVVCIFMTLKVCFTDFTESTDHLIPRTE